MKRILAVAAFLAALVLGTCPAGAAGTISLSLSQQFDAQGKPLSGCKLYFYAAGTTTPQTAYQNSGLSLAWPWPLECDASGRLPQFFLADGSIKIRLTDKAGGYVAIAADNLLVIGPSSGGGGGGTVDATTVAATGDIKHKYGTGPISGWVRANGRSIGSAASGANERANADTQALYEYLWNTDPNLGVNGGRGVSANADWVANKSIALPDARGRTLAALDDMGSSAAGRLSAGYLGATPTVLGAAGGAQSVALSIYNQPPQSYTPSGIIYGSTSFTVVPGRTAISLDAGTIPIQTPDSPVTVSVTGANFGFSGQTVTLGGASQPFSIVPPTILTTIYIKL